MKLIITLPNGEQIDLLDEGPNGMEYMCMCSRQFDDMLTELLESYKKADEQERKRIEGKILEQSNYYAFTIGDFDEELQQMIGVDELTDLIYNALINFARI